MAEGSSQTKLGCTWHDMAWSEQIEKLDIYGFLKSTYLVSCHFPDLDKSKN
jgi:hypothetical protein